MRDTRYAAFPSIWLRAPDAWCHQLFQVFSLFVREYPGLAIISPLRVLLWAWLCCMHVRLTTSFTSIDFLITSRNGQSAVNFLIIFASRPLGEEDSVGSDRCKTGCCQIMHFRISWTTKDDQRRSRLCTNLLLNAVKYLSVTNLKSFVRSSCCRWAKYTFMLSCGAGEEIVWRMSYVASSSPPSSPQASSISSLRTCSRVCKGLPACKSTMFSWKWDGNILIIQKKRTQWKRSTRRKYGCYRFFDSDT